MEGIRAIMTAMVVARVFFSMRCQRWFVRRLVHIAVARFEAHSESFFWVDFRFAMVGRCGIEYSCSD